jgi:hypothetical protein
MTDIKKISELDPANVNGSMEFVMVDKDNGTSNRVTLDKLKEHIKQEGTKGVQGPVGDSGEHGEKGLKGFKGSPEPDGDKGFVGSEGDKGFKGERGIEGIKGEKGIKGKHASFFELEAKRGDKGPKGPAGDIATATVADKGIKGTPGVNAEKGGVGVAGDQGLPGAEERKGNKGIKGIKGNKGIPGVTAAQIGSTTNGVGGQKGPLGSKGFKGPIGPTGLPGGTGSGGTAGNKGPRGISGSKSQWVWTAWVDDHIDTNTHGYQLIEGSTLPRYSNDDFKPIPSSVGTMRSQYGQNRFDKIGGPKTGAWDSGVYSITRPNTATNKIAILTIVPNRHDCLYMMGFTSANPAGFSSPPSFTHLNYCFYFRQAAADYGAFSIYQSGSPVKWPGTNADLVGTYKAGDQFQIMWDGINKKIMYNVPGGALGTSGPQTNFNALEVNSSFTGTFGVSSSFYYPAQGQTRFVTLRTG